MNQKEKEKSVWVKLDDLVMATNCNSPSPMLSPKSKTESHSSHQRERAESGADLLAALTKEAQNLKEKLEEEKRKLYDADLPDIAQKVEPLPTLAIKTRRVLRGHHAKLLCLDWASDGQHIVSSSQDGKVIIWDAYTTNKENAISTTTSWAMTCAYSPSQTLVASGGLDNSCNIYTAIRKDDTPTRAQKVATHTSHVTCCSFTKSDQQLLTGSGDTTCGLWDVESARLIQNFQGHSSDVMSLDFSHMAGGTSFVSGGCDDSVRVWDMRNGQCVQCFETHTADINAVKYFPSGDAVATASDDGTCRLFDLRADRELAIYGKESILFGASSVDFSLSGCLLMSGYNDYTVHLWNTLKATHLGILYGHENRVSSLQVSSDGTSLATGSWDCTIRIWA